LTGRRNDCSRRVRLRPASSTKLRRPKQPRPPPKELTEAVWNVVIPAGGFQSWIGPWVKSQNIHPPGSVKGPGAAPSITLGVQPSGARHGRGELRLQAFFFLFDGSRGWLAVELRRGRLTRRQSRRWISCRRANGRFKLCNRSATGTGMGKSRAQAEDRTDHQTRYSSTSGHTSSAILMRCSECTTRLDPRQTESI